MEEVTFEYCKSNIGKPFYLKDKWHEHLPYTLLRFENGFLTFFKRVGNSEFRYDLNEENFKRYKWKQ